MNLMDLWIKFHSIHNFTTFISEVGQARIIIPIYGWGPWGLERQTDPAEGTPGLRCEWISTGLPFTACNTLFPAVV